MIALSPSLRVYTIPPELPFVDALASGLMDRATDSSFDLVDFTILLPTRRAVRSLREAFLRLSNGSPLLLPRMMPLGDLDEEELVIAGWQELPVGLDGASEIEFPDAISSLQRHLMLTKRIQVLEGDKIYIDQAARLAIELGSLLDQVQTEQLNFFQLRSLVPDEYARHWQKTLKFLEILTEFWPEILREKGLVDPAERRNLVMKTQLSHWINNPPQKPIIVAGSTGSIPATADLIQFIAGLPEGCVVLPGLDCSLETVSVEDSETHPQHGMQRLLAKMNLEPKNIQIWPNQKIANKIKSASTARSELIFKVMWPANKVDKWRSLEPPGKKALEGVENISCPGPDEEAGVIALKLREALEIKGKTASLITPDRRLARRVAAELGRWGVEIDDSAGIPLSQTPQGSFIQLTAKLVAHQFLPIDFLAVGKHPLAAGGKKPVIFRQFIRDVEVKALRGPRPALGIEGLLELVSDNRHDLRHMLEIIQDMSAVFRKVIALPQISLNDALIAHIAFVEALASTDVDSGRERLWTGDAGEAAGSFIAELMEVGNVLGNISAASYPALLEILMVSRIVRPSFGSHPRLAIWGLLEARLQHADLVILGGLNEGTWPPDVGSDPWMSRPMRKEFGLSSPERRIGLTAHDFQQAFCAPEVTITRSTRVDGAPTVPSRWLVRLDNFLSGLMGVENSILSGQNPWLYWQSMLDRPEGLPQSITPPKPKPPVEARPRQLSVTQVETWMRDPYAVYARHILGLRALPPIDSSPDAADYGSLIHNSLDEFSRLPPELLLENQLEKLIELGSKNFEPVLKYPSVWAFWWPRFLRIAEWYIDFEVNRRQEIISVHSEVYGELNIKGKVGLFKLTAKADRIDVLKDGGLRIIDYKTGMPPTKKEVAAGFAPQLPLEAAIAQEGRFFNITANRVNYLDYWRLGGGDPAGEEFSAGAFPADLAAQAKDGLEALVRLFDDEKTPYEARPRPEAAPKYSDYEHLARVKEWSSSEGEEG